ncbi:MAG TPA: ShlB/FhaC/HecB family hemolysin secretion/activation protein [Crenotrichaceae bacterium]|nr:ShlB/FhaC/HecB family hemolysin secretion/activation protein [Crenotrichaceae bacterium]
MDTLRLFCCLLLWAASNSGVIAGSGQFRPPITERPSATLPELPEFETETPAGSLEQPDQNDTAPASTDALSRIYVKAFRFEGNTVFDDSTLQEIAAPYTGRAVSLSELEELRYKLSQLYLQNGYPNSGAVLPSQQFNDGVIRFRIIEGKLSEIRIQGTERLNPDYIRDRLMLASDPLLNSKALEKRFRLLIQDPLIERMDGRLSPGLAPGESILDIKVKRAKPYQLGISTNNYRPPSTGGEQGELFGFVRNLTGYGDTLDFSGAVSAGSASGSGGFSIPVTRYDTQLFLRASYNRAKIVEKPLDDLKIRNKFWSVQVGVNQPVYRSLERTFYAGMRFEFRKNRNKLDGKRFSFSEGEDDGISKVSVLRFTQDYIERHARQVLAFRSIFSLGVDVLDSTQHAHGIADGDFYAWLGQLQYAWQVMDNGAQLLFRGNVQLSSDRLLPLEQFALGGVHSVRGYRENEVVTDQGFDLSLEFRYPLIGGTGYFANPDFPGTLYVIPFMDYGGAWDVNNGKQIELLHSVGAGLRWIPIPQVSAEIYYAHDLNTARKKTSRDLQDRGVFFNVTYLAF